MFQLRHVSFASVGRAFMLLALLFVAGCGSPEQRAQSYYERGTKFLEQKDYVKAGIEFKNALQLKKDLVGAWRGLAQIEEYNQDPRKPTWENLAIILKTVVELDPKDVDSRVKLARLLLATNALDQALDLINAAGELDNRNATVLAVRAAVLLRLNDDIGTRREARAALEIDPTNVEALIVLAAERLARGDAQGALQILDRQAAAHETDLAIQLFRGLLFQKLGDHQQLEALYRKLAEKYPQESAFRRRLIAFYVDQKRPGEAEKELRALFAANSANVETGFDLVRFVGHTKGPAAARQELVNLINASTEAFQYQVALAEFDVRQGNAADGIKALEKLTRDAKTQDQALTALAKLGEIHLSRKDLDAAEAVVADILRKDDRNTNGLRFRALIRIEQGQLDAAIADARRALNDQPRSTPLMLLLATAYERGGSIELAEKQYADATKASASNPAVGLTYVAFLRRRGNVERAEDILIELAARWPTNVAVLSALADVRLTRRNWLGAEEIAEKLRQIGVGDDRGLADQITGAALSGRGRYDDSIKVLQSAYASAPAAAQPMATLVRAMVRAQKLDQAVTFLQGVLKANPANTSALILLGSVQLLKNEPAQAVMSFKAAIDHQSDNVIGYEALANFYLGQKNIDEAAKVIGAGLQRLPDNLGLRLLSAGVLELKGNYEDAIAEYEYVLKQQPGSLIVANNLASLLSDHRTDKASLERAFAVAAMLRKTQVPHFKDTLGWVYYQRGDYRNAVALLEEAAADLPNVPQVSYHLGMTYLALGQFAKASEQFKKALELAPYSELQTKIRAAQDKLAM